MIEIRRMAISLQSVHLGRQKRRIPRGSIHRALLHSSATTRLTGRSPSGDIVLLEEQDRSLWNRDYIKEGLALVEYTLATKRFGPYTLQAAIAAVHAEAPNAAETNWTRIVEFYDLLLGAELSPIVELNRAVAVAMRDGPAAGLNVIDTILAQGKLENYHLAHAARADFCRRLGRTADARASYGRALSLAQQEPEQRFLKRRLSQLS